MSTIAIFDSGVGGLSIYQEIVQRCPGHRYVFVSDNAAFPYGIKAENDLLNRVRNVVSRIVAHYAPDVLVVACNTASTVALPGLREQFEFPIVGVVPAIKPAASISKTKTIGLLATPATVNRNYTQNLISEFADNCKVIRVGSSEMVDLAEDKLHGRPVATGDIEMILRPFIIDLNVDSLVLACTHFPLLNNEIRSIFNAANRKIVLVDSALAIARRVAALVQNVPDCLPAQSIAVFTRSIDNDDQCTHFTRRLILSVFPRPNY